MGPHEGSGYIRLYSDLNHSRRCFWLASGRGAFGLEGRLFQRQGRIFVAAC